jgi:rRNA processing protein Gar1
MSTPSCVINPKTGRAVKADSKIGKMILGGKPKTEPKKVEPKKIEPKKVEPKKETLNIFELMKNFNLYFKETNLQNLITKNKENEKDILTEISNKYNEYIGKIDDIKNNIDDPTEWVKNLTKEQKQIVKEYGLSSKRNTLIKRVKNAKKQNR